MRGAFAGGPAMSFATIDEAVAAIRAGDFVVVVDDSDREDEGDLILAAEKATEAKVAFLVRYTSGLVCVPIIPERLEDLGLPLMVLENRDTLNTAFTISVDLRDGTTTGVSAADRAATIRALCDPARGAADFSRPGHVFPLRYREGGVLVRPGHTEAAVDLARLAGLYPAGVLCEVVNDDGTMAKGEQLHRFAEEHGMPIVTIADLVDYLAALEEGLPPGGVRTNPLQRVAEARLPTEFGDFRAVGYRSLSDGEEHIALVKGDVTAAEDVLLRVHSECLTGDVLGSLRCDCRSQLREAQRRVCEEGMGVILYFRGHEGRGIGLLHKLAAYGLQDEGRDTVEANIELGLPSDARDYGVGAAILSDLGVRSVRLLTNNPQKQSGLEQYGVKVTQRMPLEIPPTPQNAGYLRAKSEKLGHLIDVDETP